MVAEQIVFRLAPLFLYTIPGACRAWDELAAEVGERLKYSRFFVAQAHYAPQNREYLRSLSTPSLQST